MKKISVITVCLNEVKLIEKTLTSVINQTFRDFEYIVIDGGSTDGTLEIIEKYQDKIDKFVSEKDDGIYDAMNKGIKLAEGEYIIFINGGDYLVNDKIFEKVFKLNPTEDIIYGDTLIQHKNILFRKPALNKVTPFYLYVDTIPHQNAFTKKELFNTIGLFDTSYPIAADYDFFLKAYFKNNSTFKYLGFPIAVNNLLGVSANPRNKHQTYSERKEIQDKWFNSKIHFFRKIDFFLRWFYKKPVYATNIFCSILSKKYLKIEEIN